MPSPTKCQIDKKIGYARLALVCTVTAVLVALGMGIAYINAPVAGRHCSVRNATARDAAGHVMMCNPSPSGSHDVVWQYLPGA
ncbi:MULTISPECIES: hypothetical protein [unclassified Mycobacterium]|uniref:hypothetical protein n=1 Tax=unclassified Mycobacterium TaxID=2642494 RepID=UPI0007FC7902|nr:MULTISPECIES: hypothetical protein [unclassified Mycobacterium]OBG75566.1 hypothetical protein A5700_23910 [Mycobacterium sp. E1214]OBH27202.1 hypothetical protein A5693_24195 [Mycobacterium sp. E1319]